MKHKAKTLKLLLRLGLVPAKRLTWYQHRLDLLQHVQAWMREPERTLVCDIIANGQLLFDPNGTRYGKHNKQHATLAAFVARVSHKV